MTFFHAIVILASHGLFFLAGCAFYAATGRWKRRTAWIVLIAEGDRAPIHVYGPFWSQTRAVRWEMAFNAAIARKHPASRLEAHVGCLAPEMIPADPARSADALAEAVEIVRQRPTPRHPPQLHVVE